MVKEERERERQRTERQRQRCPEEKIITERKKGLKGEPESSFSFISFLLYCSFAVFIFCRDEHFSAMGFSFLPDWIPQIPEFLIFSSLTSFHWLTPVTEFTVLSRSDAWILLYNREEQISCQVCPMFFGTAESEFDK